LGIDRIGKGGASSPPDALRPSEGATRPSASAEAPFEVKGTAVAPAARIDASEALRGVQSGDLDVKGYVDAKVHEATAHLTNLTSEQRAAVERVVRAQLVSDPHLRDLVQHATGAAVPEEDD